MALPLIAYDSMLPDATVTDPGTEAGYDIDNLSDLKSYTYWKSDTTTAPINIDIDAGAGGADADFIAIVSHNLSTVSATVQILAEGTSPPTAEVLVATAIGEDTVTYIPFAAPGSTRYWRIVLGHASTFPAAPFAAMILLGLKMELPHYLDPSLDPFFDDIDVVGPQSEGGHWLAGETRGRMHRGRISFGDAGAARSWFTSDGNAFVEYAKLRKPWVFVLDTADSDFAVARLLKLPADQGAPRNAVGGSWQSLTFEIPFEEAYREPVSA